ncbi:MAG: redoxin family protein [Candidatus Eremiobacterota bacterium]
MKRNTITIIELVIVICVIVVAVRVLTYKKPKNKPLLPTPIPTTNSYNAPDKKTTKGETQKEKQKKEIRLAPDITFEDLQGNSIELKNYRGKKIVLLVFLGIYPERSSYGGDYSYRINGLTNLYDNYSDKDVETLVVFSIVGNKKKTEEWVNKNNIKFKIAFLSNYTCTFKKISAFTNGMPSYFLIDKQGRIIYDNDFHAPTRDIMDEAVKGNVQQMLECSNGF